MESLKLCGQRKGWCLLKEDDCQFNVPIAPIALVENCPKFSKVHPDAHHYQELNKLKAQKVS